MVDEIHKCLVRKFDLRLFQLLNLFVAKFYALAVDLGELAKVEHFLVGRIFANSRRQ